ncbi:MAG: hypothetical protein LIP18_08110, partial [Planctomycetes bacterium]|nr:hypothetical protein [Planctomycetota bacterium]
MPRCNSCGKNYDNPSILELVKNQENRWLMICRHCIDMGVDVNLVEQGNIVVEAHALATADTQSVSTVLSGDPIADARRLLDTLRNLRQSKERVGRARSHERKPVEMKVYFTLARDDTGHEGTVR